MNQENLDRAARLTAQRQEYEDIAYRYVCGMCSSKLFVPWNARTDTFEVVCTKDRTHKGHERLKSLYETWRRGGTLPVEVAQALAHKYGEKEN